MNAVLPFAAETGQIDADISVSGYGAGGNLPLERVCLVVREAVVFQLQRAVAVVVEFDPAIAVRVVGRQYFADGQRVEVLRGEHRVEARENLAVVRSSGRGHAAVAIRAVRCARVRNIRIQNGNLHLRNQSKVCVGDEDVVAALAQPEVCNHRVGFVFCRIGRVENEVFARAKCGAFGYDELVQLAKVVRNAVTGEIQRHGTRVVELDPVRRAERIVHKRALVAGDDLVDHERAAIDGIFLRTRKKQRQHCRGDECERYFFRQGCLFQSGYLPQCM